MRIERVRRGWTQEDLARRLRVKRPEASKLENAQQISVGRMLQLDDIFGGLAWRSSPTVNESVAPYGADPRIEMLSADIAKLQRQMEAVLDELRKLKGRKVDEKRVGG